MKGWEVVERASSLHSVMHKKRVKVNRWVKVRCVYGVSLRTVDRPRVLTWTSVLFFTLGSGTGWASRAVIRSRRHIWWGRGRLNEYLNVHVSLSESPSYLNPICLTAAHANVTALVSAVWELRHVLWAMSKDKITRDYISVTHHRIL